ncbi:nuclear autoantigenic sperm protein-like [Juglans microcarpa x Juglans regia]|uniref:nuclear autoantigenic sperm protein-like n=1 Tax=Juglans microcarpa x Juglans regia TaxID=2249226 RepID=UPI001B7F3727|nr:nuclear autoantigenic sperm protein-like [Juglans microcarpa x Juglans regia]
MDSPFFTNHWSFPSRAREVPVQRKATPSRKVVSIPVHFVGSERNMSDSALKIQKVFRGFLVRKSMREIAAIRRKVDEIDRKMSEKATKESIRSDPKERLRVNETLMSLLFKLDSVRGVDSGIRDCRKAVIKRAIALQELVDAIASGEQNVGHVGETLQAEAVHPNQEPSRMEGDDLRAQASETESSTGNMVDNSCNLSVDRETLEEVEDEVEDSVPDSVDSEKINDAESIPDSRMATIEPYGTHKLQAPEKAYEESEKVDLGGVDAAGMEMEVNDGEIDYDMGPNSVESERTGVARPTPDVEPDETLKLQVLEQACKNSEESENVDLGGVDASGTEMEVKDGEMDDDLAPNSVESETTNVSESTPIGEPDKTLKLQALEQVCENSEKVGGADTAGNEMEAKGEELVEDHEGAPSANECMEESVGTSQTASGSSTDPESLDEVVEENSSKQEEQLKIDNKYGSVKEECDGPGGRVESKRSSELLERIMEDNERMTRLMAELFVRNEMQTRLLNSLSQRVGQMERAFICEKLRRKKKRLAAGDVDDVQNLKDTRNCGKR